MVDERSAVIDYATKRLAMYKAKGYDEAATAMGVLIGDLRAEFHHSEDRGAHADPIGSAGYALAAGNANRAASAPLLGTPNLTSSSGPLRAGDELTPLAGQHLARREQDEYVCSRCAKRWGVDEDAPEMCAV